MKVLIVASSVLAATLLTGFVANQLDALPYTPWSIAALASIVTVILSAMSQKLGARPSSKNSEDVAGTKERGTVKWFNATKGFGFITCDNGDEVFVHFRALKNGGRRSLRDGLAVSFVITSGERGPQASQVEIL